MPQSESHAEEGHPRDSFLVRLVTHPVTTWWIRTFSARVDPWLYRLSNGRFHTMGTGSESMVTITMTGRKSGKPRSVHLACVHHEGDILLVASAMGQEKHPGWRYNLEANPDVQVQAQGECFDARAQMLTDAEKDEVWPEIQRAIPQLEVYEGRTDRNIRVFRLSRVGS